MSVDAEVRRGLAFKQPKVLCLSGAGLVVLATFVMPWLSFRYGGIQAFWAPYGSLDALTLLLVLAVIGLAITALNRIGDTIERWMAVTATVLFSVILALCVVRGATFETFVAFVGGLGCLAGGLCVFFPDLFDRARAAMRTGNGPGPGWYEDPAGSSGVRWWDGRRWAQDAHRVDTLYEESQFADERVHTHTAQRRINVER